ncbi:MBOAT family O-acyltransferase [Anaerovibrio slackiae]|uniref:MBOAT family O-acyltransferase n=1 Tax=Anaerovibrio slackiae TaxID=2652309 RepID=UPI003F16274F
MVYYNPLFHKNITFRNVWLMIASLIFYGWGEPKFIIIMLIAIILTWGLGLLIQCKSMHKKLFLTIGICMHVGLLFVFKYLTFSWSIFYQLIGNEAEIIQIALPIGISFFTFQLMSYLFDIYYGNAVAQKNVLNVILYISFFPQLIAGPIVRYRQIELALALRREDFNTFCDGFYRFVIGLSKKMLISNYVAQIADNMFVNGAELSVASAWLGAIAYTLQIYFDFSGYSDMAIGLGKMFGFKFPENFNYPYIAKSVTDFWKRWHMSLTGWFRDYVYIPLGGNRVSKCLWVRNLLFVWLITGIWHGANWTFIAWGLLYFIVLLLEKTTGFHKHMNVIFAHCYTLFIVVLAWVIFRSPDLEYAFRYISIMFGNSTVGIIDDVFLYYLWHGKIVMFIAMIFSAPVIPYVCSKLNDNKCVYLKSLAVIVLFFMSLLQVVSGTYNPFIYFNF